MESGLALSQLLMYTSACLTFSCTFLHFPIVSLPPSTHSTTWQLIVLCSSATLVCTATNEVLLCSQFNQWLSLAVPQKTDKTSQLQTQLSVSPDTGIQVAAREPTQCPERVHSSPFSSSQLTGSEEGNCDLQAWQRGRRLLLASCLPVYVGLAKLLISLTEVTNGKTRDARE